MCPISKIAKSAKSLHHNGEDGRLGRGGEGLGDSNRAESRGEGGSPIMQIRIYYLFKSSPKFLPNMQE